MPLLQGDDAADVRRAAAHWAAGELLAFPTETVYGLGARADDDQAVARIFSAKGRPAEHPLIVHVASIDAARFFCADTAQTSGTHARRLMAAFWPGPLTVIVPRHPARAAAAAGGQDSIGLRMPSHPVALALLLEAAALGVPGVAAPSANRFGRVSPTTAAHVQQAFGPDMWVVDGGACTVGIESCIVDCTGPHAVLLRPGQIERRHIEDVLGQPLGQPGLASPRASGTLASHYAPRARVTVLSSAELARRLAQPPPLGQSVGVYSRLVPPAGAAWFWRAMPLDAAAAAQELFAALHDFDAALVTDLWVQEPPPDPDWDGVRDRLQRAAT
jgi:L-threonylcarbamoyladenylate synthase